MVTQRAHTFLESTRALLLTPEGSPRLSAIDIGRGGHHSANMSTEDLSTTIRPSGDSSPAIDQASSHTWPTLQEILNDQSRAPYTLSAFIAYLSQQHCLETLEFTMAAKHYQAKHSEMTSRMASSEPDSASDEAVKQLQQEWARLLDVYIKPGAPREVNLFAEERDNLLRQEEPSEPPAATTLDGAVQQINELMTESILLPFLTSFAQQGRAQPCCNSGRSCCPGRLSDSPVIASFYDSRAAELTTSNADDTPRCESSPSSTRCNPGNPQSAATSQPHSMQASDAVGSALLCAGVPMASINPSCSPATSARSSCGLSDDAMDGNSVSAADGDPMTPPTTPPGSEMPEDSVLPQRHSPAPSRNHEGGSWKKVGMKFLGKKKVHGSVSDGT